MTAFACLACGRQVTNSLQLVEPIPKRSRFEGILDEDGLRRAPSTVARGTYAVDPEPWGIPLVHTDEPVAVCGGGPCVDDPDSDGFLVSAGPRNTIVIHPDDAPDLEIILLNIVTCCGSPGYDHEANRRCPCGSAIGTLMSECYTAHELHLDPRRVRAL